MHPDQQEQNYLKQEPCLYVALSGHGFGHLAQVAPVLNELQRRHPKIRLVVQTIIPEVFLNARIMGNFSVVSEASDFGMLMVDALTARVADSLEAYRVCHASWDARLDRQTQIMQAAKPDVLLADIPYLGLAAAARLQIPSLALCSLNWADILCGYCQSEPDVADLCAPMLDAYNSAVAFLQPTPSMPMPQLSNTQSIGVIAAPGQERRVDIDRQLGLRGGETLILMGLGGVDMRPPLETWPVLPSVHWLLPPTWDVARSDMFTWDRLIDCSMLDLICSCDVLVTKPGYGAFTEAACNGTRVLFVERDDWPEEPWLSRWLLAYGNAVKISRQQLTSGDLAEPLQQLLAQPARAKVVPTGVAEAVDWLEHLMM
ncbi:MAG: hypothetical protein CSA09_01450 [Candidatus Contendobacter odensis]|uniref:Glycosyl transferase family 28 C-terminal domain-containing protein n=1 Tax=Candidatus Contendibacter odensensis TaxID=1400860 RepID=A0A2G6PGB0_9GAMM|nr:MAG: hypothetical protein CSA09_01450 [Candidatus Contendobacter odensis]